MAGTGIVPAIFFDHSDNKKWFLCPNPAAEHLYIELPESTAAERIIITDLSGRVFYNEEFESDELFHDIDVSNYSKGLYIIKFVTPYRIFEKKVVIK